MESLRRVGTAMEGFREERGQHRQSGETEVSRDGPHDPEHQNHHHRLRAGGGGGEGRSVRGLAARTVEEAKRVLEEGEGEVQRLGQDAEERKEALATALQAWEELIAKLVALPSSLPALALEGEEREGETPSLSSVEPYDARARAQAMLREVGELVEDLRNMGERTQAETEALEGAMRTAGGAGGSEEKAGDAAVEEGRGGGG
ncbi:hypothetical protein NSK_008281 [Nannochloropsis salina CCMP1776]|uniref:Uncharacterized protein n=1 Tax=Nannochloropsis salina CCMP1776 TaxID=1027361 RepID=A0A4D9CPF0_9STRA|nr:hypothetical protein NSK_008281 [Nannochloropsis salina CCMP1776]|eukprot:TFJ80374.1 hypothetical protein NSK_008281 [Nannochloropsis salina CCMP1776]